MKALAGKMGVSSSYISQIIHGTRKPGRDVLVKLSGALNVPIGTLLSFDEDISGEICIPREVPVLSVKHSDNNCALVPETAAYAATDDQDAFYLNLHGLHSLGELALFDRILIQPNAKIESGDIILLCSPQEISVRKITAKDDFIALLNDKEPPILLQKGSMPEETRLLRATYCLKYL